MKKLLILLILLFSINIYSQNQQSHNNKKGELNFESDSGKFFQGAIISSFTYFTIQQFTFESEDEWIKIPLSILTAFSYEMLLNSKTNDRKQLFVLGGAITVNVTFEIFKSKKRKML